MVIRGVGGGVTNMIKQLFRCGKHWLFGEPLVKIETGGKWFYN